MRSIPSAPEHALSLPRVQAFSALVLGHKLSNADEVALVGKLAIPEQHGWLRHLYRAHCKKYECSSSVEQALGE